MDNCVLMAGARDKLGSAVDSTALLASKASTMSPVQAPPHLFMEYRRRGGWSPAQRYTVMRKNEEDGLQDADVYIDVGDDPDLDLDREAILARLIEKARENGFTTTGARRLYSLVTSYKAILGSGRASPDQPTSR